MNEYLKKLEPEVAKLGLPPDKQAAISAAISLKRIADKLPGDNMETLIAQIARGVGNLKQKT